MPNIAVQTEGPKPQPESAKPQPQKAQPQRSFKPTRWIRSLLGRDPFRAMSPFARMERWELVPEFEITETKDRYLFKADVPGIALADLDVSVAGRMLTVAGKRESEREEKTDTQYLSERSFGSFSRSFTLPESADEDSVTADLTDGVLTLALQKKQGVETKKVEVNGEKKTPK